MSTFFDIVAKTATEICRQNMEATDSFPAGEIAEAIQADIIDSMKGDGQHE